MTDANAGLGGAFDSYSVQGKVFINLSLWVLRVWVETYEFWRDKIQLV